MLGRGCHAEHDLPLDSMPDRPQVLHHLGPYSSHEPVAAFGSISDRAISLYHEAAGGHLRQNETPTQHLTTRMMYISEATSVALRLNASWALTHPALSLLRDRYEQVVRFSWLARQPDNSEMAKYLTSYYAKSNKLHRSMPEGARDLYAKRGFPLEEWMTEKPTKELEKWLNEWSALDLRSMVEKRDKLTPLSDCAVAKERLSWMYDHIYAQFSSVTHYDMYSMTILGLLPAPDGQLVLAPDPGFPAVISLHNSLFDLIQCFEGTRRFLGVDFDSRFCALLDEWHDYAKRTVKPSQP
jgi:hypothetical protein